MVEKSNINALKLAFSFFKGNIALSLAAIAILLVISFFSILPLIGIVFVFAYSILSLSIQIYFGRGIKEVKSIEEMENFAKDTKIGDFLTKYIAEATGAFLALFFISLVFIFAFALLTAIFSGTISMEEIKGMNEQQIIFYMMSSYSIPGTVMLLIAGFFFYIFPAVMGEVILSEGFNEAFKKVFLLINPAFWKKTFKKDYFLLILFWSIIVFIFGIFIVFLSSTIILLPIVLILAYILSLYNAGIYLFAKDLAKE
ncbi:hypothetical protein [Nitrosophilus kaiyonis]|uniref:hypothetical protein n=1 Tax=Nitrosophilus kaiyonis TaxID=2930200 RepID=UPI002490EF13|nr:hypothetical protein [Nitrosophilus kaiyonis]